MGEVVPFLPNYTGPFISDGKIQTSVEFGEAEPKDALDALSRYHDSAYYRFKDKGHRMAADSIYADEAAKLEGKFPQLAGHAVRYGNQIKDSLSNIASPELLALGPFALLGLVKGGLQNAYHLHDYMINGDKYKREVLDYYKTDPKLKVKPVAAGGGEMITYDPPTYETNGEPYVTEEQIDFYNRLTEEQRAKNRAYEENKQKRAEENRLRKQKTVKETVQRTAYDTDAFNHPRVIDHSEYYPREGPVVQHPLQDLYERIRKPFRRKKKKNKIYAT